MRKITVKVPVTFTINADEGVSLRKIVSNICIDSVSQVADGFSVEDAEIACQDFSKYEIVDSR